MKVLLKKQFNVLTEKYGWPRVGVEEGSVDSGGMALQLAKAANIAMLGSSNLETHPPIWPETCNEFSRAELNGSNVKILLKEKCQVVAERNGWSFERARGYVDGETFRLRAKKPSQYPLVGIDEYSLGFRAGYYERREASRVSFPGASEEGRMKAKV